MDKELKREIIIDNYQNPFNKGLVEDGSYMRENGSSDNCIDNLDFMVKVDGGIVKDIRFDGEACAISTSAASIIIRLLIGKSVEEAKKLLNNYQNMINEKEYDEKLLEELVVYDEVGKQPNRKNCVLLPSRVILELLNKLNG